MTIQIPLKRKYLTGFKSRHQGGERPAPRKRRNKIGAIAHEKRFGKPKVMCLYVDGATGNSVMREVTK